LKQQEHSTLEDRVVVVTGSARGIGRAFANALLEAGAKVVVSDRHFTGTEPFDPKWNDRLLTGAMDVTNEDQIDALYAKTLEKFGTVDALINNAGLRQRDLFPPTGRITTLETKDSDWEKSFGVNVFGTLKVTRRFVKPMIEKKRGSIASIVSSGILHHSHGGAYRALRPDSREMPYQSGKAALATMMFYLADEIRQHNVAVNLVIPSHTMTTGFEEQNRARLAKGDPPGVTPVMPEHLIPLLMHLADQDASAVTGKMFDAMTWNEEHGHGGPERWKVPSFSYEALMPKK
jgi:NAD(P)-dependent dehydrogenase (short-subunit alcohol dehydrogenase family)